MSQAALALPGKATPERVDPFAWRSQRQRTAPGTIETRGAVPRRRAKIMFALAIAIAMFGLGKLAYRVAPVVQPILASLSPSWITPAVRIENVSSRLIDNGHTLLVEGTVVNRSGRTLSPPMLRLAIRAADASEIFVWTVRPVDAHLAPDGRTRFSSRLAAPPTGGVEVTVAMQPAGE